MTAAPLISMQWDVRAEKELLAGLRTLRGRFLRAAVRNAVRKGARPMARRAKANVPVEFGFTRKSIGTKVKSYRDGNVIAVTGPRRGPNFVYQGTGKPFTAGDGGTGTRTVLAFAGRAVKRVPANTAHLIEFGTKPHRLGSGVQVGRGSSAKGRTAEQTGALHPGTRPRPFMSTGYRQSVGESRAIVTRELRNEIVKQARKQAARDAARAAKGGR